MMMYPPYPFFANAPFIGVKPAVMPGYDMGASQPVLLGMRAPAHSGGYAPVPIMQPGQQFMVPIAGPQQPVYPMRPCRFPGGNFMPVRLPDPAVLYDVASSARLESDAAIAIHSQIDSCEI